MLIKSLQSNWEDFNVILFGDSENRDFPGDYIDAINRRRKITGTPQLQILPDADQGISVDDQTSTITDTNGVLSDTTYLNNFTASNGGKLIYETNELTNDEIIVKTQLNVETERFEIVVPNA